MKQGSKLKRSRLVRRPAGAAALFVLLLLPLSPLARANSSNLLPNGSFQSETSGWTTSNAALTIASDGGVAGYAIYRDGGASAIGTVSGSTTSFADTSVAPGSTYAYTVAAFDAAGNYSPQSAPSDAVTTPQPQSSAVGLWHLDELSGTTAYDSSGHGHNGAISGPVTLGVPGELNTAYSFVPKSTVIVPDAPDLEPGTADVTISYWLNSTTLPPCCNGIDYDMLTKGDHSSSGGQIKIEVQENGQASCMFRGALGGRQLQAGPNVVDGHWHQVMCQRIGTQIIETVDGSSFSTTKATGAITVTDPIRLGSHKNGGDWYNGVLDEVTYSIGSGSTNQAPVVNAGPDQTITLPSSANLNGTVTDDGLPNPPGTVTTTWSEVSGPGAATFGNASAVDTTASFSAAGTYVLKLEASDSLLSSSDTATITVNPASQNQPPTVNAGPDQTVILPNSATLSGTASDDGLPNPPGTLITTWSQLSGPGTVTFGDASSLSTTASFSASGTYVLRLTADDSALRSSDDLTVTVNPASQNQPPTVNAGPDQTVILPNSATLSGTASDDGLPNPPGTLITAWSQFSGPGTVTFGNASSLSTTASFSASGIYVLRLTADDSALQSSEDLTVTVNSASQDLVGNPGFETDTTGWNSSGSDAGVTLTRVSGGHSGGWSGLVANGGSGTAATCKMQDVPNWVTTTSAGTYTGSMWVRADSPGATLTIKLREYNGSALVAVKTASIKLTTSWQMVSVSYVPAMPGTTTLDFLGLVSNAPVGTCFYADDISIVVS